MGQRNVPRCSLKEGEVWRQQKEWTFRKRETTTRAKLTRRKVEDCDNPPSNGDIGYKTAEDE